MASTIKLTSTEVLPDGSFVCVYEINGAGGMGRQWPSKTDAQEALPPIDEDALIGYLMAYWESRSSNWANPAIVLNKTMTVDWAAPNPIRIN